MGSLYSTAMAAVISGAVSLNARKYFAIDIYGNIINRPIDLVLAIELRREKRQGVEFFCSERISESSGYNTVRK